MPFKRSIFKSICSPDGFFSAVMSFWLAVFCGPLQADNALNQTETGTARIDWEKERQFWAFTNPRPHPLPPVRNIKWPRQPIDHFLLSRMESAGLVPQLEANRRVLIRRLTLDLHGLNPTPAQVDRFVHETAPDAVERLVDRLLASPRFGERMASLWLPLARYAEDQAHQVGDDTKFFYPYAWKYRDWVIRSFNQDMRYDVFMGLQIAADKIEGTNSPNLAALGFLGLGPKYYDRGRLAVQADEWEDRVDTVCRTMLGLTVACARCHDHKYEPITMQDYYSLAGVFSSTRMANRTLAGASLKDDLSADKMPSDTVHVIEDSEKIQDLPVFLRGNVERKGPVAKRRFLRILEEDNAPGFIDGSGRAELAAKIASPSNPLAARVFVNRIWALVFGRPLVATPSNFGHSGMPPADPELLDDLSFRFMASGWSLKQLVRELVLSSAYRQGSGSDMRKASRDPANDFLSRMNRRRLSIEQWRDTVLQAAGVLDFSGGPSKEVDDPANRRRTVHARISRLKLNDLLIQFDYPDANVHAEKRGASTSAFQKLFLLNSDFMAENSKSLAANLKNAGAEDDSKLVRTIYEVLFCRPPDVEELRLGLDYLSRPGPQGISRWAQYAQLLMASNEMLYVD